jgi:hypothetical protein
LASIQSAPDVDLVHKCTKVITRQSRCLRRTGRAAVTSLLALVVLHGAWVQIIAAWWAILLFYVVSGQIQRRASLYTWRVLLSAPFSIL